MKKIILFALVLTCNLNLFGGLTPEEMDEIEAGVVEVAPKAEAPKAEAPKAEAPKAEAPKAQTQSEMEIRIGNLERKVEVHDLQIKAVERRIELVEDTTRLVNHGITSMVLGQWWRNVSSPFRKAATPPEKEDKK
jgi:hypothetical protein